MSLLRAANAMAAVLVSFEGLNCGCRSMETRAVSIGRGSCGENAMDLDIVAEGTEFIVVWRRIDDGIIVVSRSERTGTNGGFSLRGKLIILLRAKSGHPNSLCGKRPTFALEYGEIPALLEEEL